jgi:hypothetical protein
MRERRQLIADSEGALHMIEAAIAAFLIFSTLACIQTMAGHLSAESDDDQQQLRQMTTDLLYILEHGQNGPGHPGLAQALSSQTAWSEQSAALVSEMYSYVPAGYKVYLCTPCGDVGDCPPDLVSMSVRPFLAYRVETGEIMDCSLVVWRP